MLSVSDPILLLLRKHLGLWNQPGTRSIFILWR